MDGEEVKRDEYKQEAGDSLVSTLMITPWVEITVKPEGAGTAQQLQVTYGGKEQLRERISNGAALSENELGKLRSSFSNGHTTQRWPKDFVQEAAKNSEDADSLFAIMWNRVTEDAEVLR